MRFNNLVFASATVLTLSGSSVAAFGQYQDPYLGRRGLYARNDHYQYARNDGFLDKLARDLYERDLYERAPLDHSLYVRDSYGLARREGLPKWATDCMAITGFIAVTVPIAAWGTWKAVEYVKNSPRFGWRAHRAAAAAGHALQGGVPDGTYTVDVGENINGQWHTRNTIQVTFANGHGTCTGI